MLTALQAENSPTKQRFLNFSAKINLVQLPEATQTNAEQCKIRISNHQPKLHHAQTTLPFKRYKIKLEAHTAMGVALSPPSELHCKGRKGAKPSASLSLHMNKHSACRRIEAKTIHHSIFQRTRNQGGGGCLAGIHPGGRKEPADPLNLGSWAFFMPFNPDVGIT